VGIVAPRGHVLVSTSTSMVFLIMRCAAPRAQ
jgi:hypothetical protein